MLRKPVTQEQKNQVRDACKLAMPHGTISVSTGIIRNAKYINSEFISFDILIPMSLGMNMVFGAKALDKFDFFYIFETGILVRFKELDPLVLEQMFKEKFFTVCFQKHFVRTKNGDIISKPVAFSIEKPNMDYEELFLQHVSSFFPPNEIDQEIVKKEWVLRMALKAMKIN